MEPGYHKAAKIFALYSTMAKQSLDIIKCLFFMINDASHLAKSAINYLKNSEHFDASKGDQFYLSDIKTLRSNGEEQTVTEITAVLTDT